MAVPPMDAWMGSVEDRLDVLEAGGGGGGGGSTGGGGIGSLFIASPTASDGAKRRIDAAGGVVLDSDDDAAEVVNEAAADVDNQYETRVGQDNPQYGSVVLSEGVFNCKRPFLMLGRGYTLLGSGPGTVLRPSVSASSFDVSGAEVVNGKKALVMASSSTVGQNASMCQIADLSINAEQWGDDSALSGIAINLTEVPVSGSTSPDVFGLPIPTNKNDQNWTIRNVRVYGVEMGIGWTDTDGARDFFIRDCWVGAFSRYGIYVGASDSQVQGCQAITQTDAGGVGFHLGGGNTKFWNSKASYTDVGVALAAGRIKVENVESQDCTIGFDGNGSDDATLVGCDADTQESGSIGFDLDGCEDVNVAGCKVFTRGDGTWSTGVNLPTGSGSVSMNVGEAGINKQVTVNGTEINRSVDLPDDLIVRISRRGTGNLVSDGNVA